MTTWQRVLVGLALTTAAAALAAAALVTVGRLNDRIDQLERITEVHSESITELTSVISRSTELALLQSEALNVAVCDISRGLHELYAAEPRSERRLTASAFPLDDC